MNININSPSAKSRLIHALEALSLLLGAKCFWLILKMKFVTPTEEPLRQFNQPHVMVGRSFFYRARSAGNSIINPPCTVAAGGRERYLLVI